MKFACINCSLRHKWVFSNKWLDQTKHSSIYWQSCAVTGDGLGSSTSSSFDPMIHFQTKLQKYTFCLGINTQICMWCEAENYFRRKLLSIDHLHQTLTSFQFQKGILQMCWGMFPHLYTFTIFFSIPKEVSDTFSSELIWSSIVKNKIQFKADFDVFLWMIGLIQKLVF